MRRFAHRHGPPLIADNTVSSHALCQPFEHGADLALHSITKYCGGRDTARWLNRRVGATNELHSETVPVRQLAR
jgi:hypothetical protein